MTAADRLKQIQQSLAEHGLYSGEIDARWGQQSKEAFGALLKAVDLEDSGPKGSVPVPGDPVDARSEKNIQTLHLSVQPLARQLILNARAKNITLIITSGSRTYAEQDALFAQGGVTKARGGYSNHNFGLAFDVTIFKDGQPVWESPLYKFVGELGKNLGLSWGGDWVSFKDEPHFELHPNWARGMSESQMLAELRDRHDNHLDYFA